MGSGLFGQKKLPDGRSMIYIPNAPSAWSGITQILPSDQITYLNVPITKVMNLIHVQFTISQWYSYQLQFVADIVLVKYLSSA